MAGRAGRAYARIAMLLLAVVALLALPQLGLASSGGAGVSPGPSSGQSPSSTPSPSVQSGNQTVSASGGGMTIVTHASAMLSNRLRFTGRARSAAGETIEIYRMGKETNYSWTPTAHGTVHRNGSFSVTWLTNHIGRFSIRAQLVGKRGPRSASSAPTVTVTVYLQAIATIYGPGFYGQKTACGETLTRKTLGTANRTLPCGTPVAIDYKGHTMVVPVIDRGPYANGANWDLTQATANALGMNGTATIGAVSLPPR